MQFGVAGVVLLFEGCHGGDGVGRGEIGVDDGVAEAWSGGFFEDEGVGVDDPVDGAVADGVGADGDAVLMEEADHLAVRLRGRCWDSRSCLRRWWWSFYAMADRPMRCGRQYCHP